MNRKSILELIVSENEDDNTLGTILFKEYYSDEIKDYEKTKIPGKIWEEIKYFKYGLDPERKLAMEREINWAKRLEKMGEIFKNLNK